MIRHILGRRPFLPYNSTMERAIPRAKRVKAERKKTQVASLEPSPIVKEVLNLFRIVQLSLISLFHRSNQLV